MISKLKRVIVIFLSVIMSFNISVISPFAASKSSERKSSAYWASADSGWSSMDYWLKYEEIYTASGSNNIFSSRTRLYAYNTVAAVNVPYMQLGNVLHKDSGGSTVATFTSFNTEPAIWDTTYSTKGFQKNTTSKTYSKTTSNQGTWMVLLICKGMLVPTQTESCTISLKTS